MCKIYVFQEAAPFSMQFSDFYCFQLKSNTEYKFGFTILNCIQSDQSSSILIEHVICGQLAGNRALLNEKKKI